MESLANNAVLTSIPLSLQTANKNNVLDEMFYQMPIYILLIQYLEKLYKKRKKKGYITGI